MSLLNETIQGVLPLYPGGVVLARERLRAAGVSPQERMRLGDLAIQLAGITGLAPPVIRHKALIVCVADHGLADHLPASRQTDSGGQVADILAGRAPVCVTAEKVGASMVVLDLGLAGAPITSAGLISKRIASGTADITQQPAMDLTKVVESIQTGIAIVVDELAEQVGVLAVDGLGAGSRVSAQAVICAITGRAPSADKEGALVKQALAANRPVAMDMLDVLQQVGGFEIGAIAGVILGAAANRLPVAIGGLTASAGALLAAGLAPLARQFMILGGTEELEHQPTLDRLGLEPDLDLGLGDGVTAVRALGMVDDACGLLE